MLLITVKLFVAVASLFGVGYGIYRASKSKMPFYFVMIICGVACAAMGRIFEILYFIFGTQQIVEGFQIGIFGVIGSILFFFTSNQGLMDRLGDDGSDAMKTCRIMGFIAPAFFLVLELVIIISGCGAQQVIVSALICLVTMLAGYFHLKHILLPDVENGIIRCLRGYNLVALLYELLCMGERVGFAYNVPEIVFAVIYILIGIMLTIILPVLERGVKRWTM